MNNTNQKLNRFSIRKYSVGVASVLVGIAFLGTPVLADQVSETSNIPQETVLSTTPKIKTPQVVTEHTEEANTTFESVAGVKVEQPAVETPSQTNAATVNETQLTAEQKSDEEISETKAVSATAEKTLPTKTIDPTNPEGKKTVGYPVSDTTEFKIFNTDAVTFPKGTSFRSVALVDGVGGGFGTWEYVYTAEPYAFYRNTKTKQWKMVQVTPTWTHVQNTVVNGWISSLGQSYNYFK